MIYGFALVGVFVTIGLAWLLILDLLDLFKKWRNDGCKIKFLCKHKYEYRHRFGEMMVVKCTQCGKILNFNVYWETFYKESGV